MLMDSHAVVCSPKLLPALRLEHRRNQFDLAINFEASVGLESETTSWSTRRPRPARLNVDLRFSNRRPFGMLPHNWALLLRRGKGADALLQAWTHSLGRMRWPDDQLALRWALLQLSERGCVGTPPSPASAAQSAAQAMNCTSLVRVMLLRERAAVGLKSADKRRLGFFPRYTRLLDGEVLATHKARPEPWPDRGMGGTAAPETAPERGDMCSLLNERPAAPRLVLQPAGCSHRGGLASTQARSRRATSSAACQHRVVFNRSACEALLEAPPPNDTAAGVRRITGRRICSMLPAQSASPAEARAAGGDSVVEPILSFFSSMLAIRSTIK